MCRACSSQWCADSVVRCSAGEETEISADVLGVLFMCSRVGLRREWRQLGEVIEFLDGALRVLRTCRCALQCGQSRVGCS